MAFRDHYSRWDDRRCQSRVSVKFPAEPELGDSMKPGLIISDISGNSSIRIPADSSFSCAAHRNARAIHLPDVIGYGAGLVLRIRAGNAKTAEIVPRSTFQ